MQPYISTFESNRSIFSADANALIDLYQTSGSSPIMGFGTNNVTANNSTRRSSNEEVHGFFELSTTGICRHYINDKLVKTHTAEHKITH